MVVVVVVDKKKRRQKQVIKEEMESMPEKESVKKVRERELRHVVGVGVRPRKGNQPKGYWMNVESDWTIHHNIGVAP